MILGDSERQVAEKFGDAAKTYVNDPIALHLRAMNMLYEGLKQNSTIVIVPSSAVETMQLGGLAGLTALTMELANNAQNNGKETRSRVRGLSQVLRKSLLDNRSTSSAIGRDCALPTCPSHAEPNIAGAQEQAMNNSPVLKEIIVTADEELLNRAIVEKHITPANIISVIYHPRRALAIGDYEARYRIIYRV